MIFESVESSSLRNGCRKRPYEKRFLWHHWTAYRPHQLEFVDFAPWGAPSWCEWEITGQCKACGLRTRRMGVSEAELARHGLLDRARASQDF